MGALAKYYEDNCRIVEERLRGKEEPSSLSPEKIKRSKKESIAIKHKMRENPFTPKKGQIQYLKNRNQIQIFIKQYLYPEWIDFLKQNGWRWNKYQKCWVKKYSSTNYDFAYKFITGRNEEPDYEPDDLYVGDKSLLYE